MKPVRTHGKMETVETRRGQVTLSSRSPVSSSNPLYYENESPTPNHNPSCPLYLQTPLDWPSSSKRHNGTTLSATSGPQMARMLSRGSPYLQGAIKPGKRHSTHVAQGFYPVAKTTMSASSSLPSANLRPVSVKRSMEPPLLILISPSMMC